jgi:hypothetical protein
MFLRVLQLVVLSLVVSAVTWFSISQLRSLGSLSTTAIDNEARSKGGMTSEMVDQYKAITFRRDAVSLGVLGAMTGLLCGIIWKSRTSWLGGIAGTLVGAGLGLCGTYFGAQHYERVEYSGASPNYWIVRWLVILTPIAVAAAIASMISLRKATTDLILGSLIGLAFPVLVISMAPGLVSNLERPDTLYPAWVTNQLLTIGSLNLGLVLANSWFSKEKSSSDANSAQEGLLEKVKTDDKTSQNSSN